mmetsp:Transcript_33072/g.61670  ORF Transcript_33072/g.61670 Transcript_33072/m.61670 type:complete len:146 (+) Transcript_33072:823-1260(+)
MYWIPTHKYWHAEFNTLYLFSVTRESNHFVTTVTPEAEEKRLAVNGWWQASWLPKTLDECEAVLDTEEKSLKLTADQVEAVVHVLGRRDGNFETHERRDALKKKALQFFETAQEKDEAQQDAEGPESSRWKRKRGKLERVLFSDE